MFCLGRKKFSGNENYIEVYFESLLGLCEEEILGKEGIKKILKSFRKIFIGG